MVKKFLGGYLSGILTHEERGKLVKSIDIVGDIAIVKVPYGLYGKRQVIAEAIMTVNRNIRTVLNQVSSVSGDFRLRKLEWIAGEKKTETVYKEYGCSFKVDVAKIYFSPRLSFERQRIAGLVGDGEVVINMFAGVGCFSILIAKHCDIIKVYSIDINPIAVMFMTENIALNKLQNKVVAIRGDSKEVITTQLNGKGNRVLMPLPDKAYDYLDAACLALESGEGVIHYYDFVYARNSHNALECLTRKVGAKLACLGRRVKLNASRIVRTVGPHWYQIVLDVKII